MRHFINLSLIVLLAACSGKPSADDLIKEKKDAELQTYKLNLQQELAKIDAYFGKTKPTSQEALVSTLVLKDTVFTHGIEIQGSIETNENIIIYPEFAGTLTLLNVKNGQRVTRGQILAKIADAGLSQQLAQAEAGYKLAKTAFDRQRNLWDKKIGSEIQYLQAETQMQTASKSVDLVKEQIAKTVVRAPFDGTIEDVQVEKGQIIAPGDPRGLMRIVNVSKIFVTTEVPEIHIGKVKVGTEVDVTVASLGKSIKGRVRQVSNNLNPQNRSFSIEVYVPNVENKLRPNQVAKLRIIDYKSVNTISIPSNVILEDGEKNKYVYIVDGDEKSGIAKRVDVKIGQSYNNFTEILKGLSPKDRIVVEGINSVSEGMKLNY